jgi:hypothetical protein
MQEQISQLQKQVDELKKTVLEIQLGKDIVFADNLDDIIVERVINSDTTPDVSNSNVTVTKDTTNTIVTNVSFSTSTTPTTYTFNALDYPERVMIYNWKGQRLAIPVYDADKIIYP